MVLISVVTVSTVAASVSSVPVLSLFFRKVSLFLIVSK
jgi:hypothetical protein